MTARHGAGRRLRALLAGAALAAMALGGCGDQNKDGPWIKRVAQKEIRARKQAMLARARGVPTPMGLTWRTVDKSEARR